MKRIIMIALVIITTWTMGAYAEEVPEVRELFTAIEKNDMQKVYLLLTNSWLVNMANEKGLSPLLYATMKDNTLAAELLAGRGADVNKTDGNGMTPLMWACAKGNEKLARLFVIRGASISQKDAEGKTAIQWAYFKGNKNIIKFLKDLGAKDEEEPTNPDPYSNYPVYPTR